MELAFTRHARDAMEKRGIVEVRKVAAELCAWS
jgi:hypothetical protein